MAKVVLCLSVIALLNSVVGVSDFCFQCRDTSDAEGKDDCQSETKGMHGLHYTYKTEYRNKSDDFLKKYGKDPLVQDCRQYHKYGMTHCCIEELERLGTIQSYIRGCCDGKNFSIEASQIPRLKFISDNNQTLCAYYENKGLVMCATMCDGNFCNGPSLAESVHMYSVGLLVFCSILFALYMT
ncbi:uncharacterized protein LOC127719878 [Mytilus californianus]|uniref:uncharacterized protein LOC127719878 n=1 Tax=Mytilus californianus TaxID=6549 RepID=UPI0022451D58|nr:uncharacterized protein LOC127719878 [Mytilus californianus]